MEKKVLRKTVLKKRTSISPDVVKIKSEQIVQQIISAGILKKQSLTALYYPYRNEVDLLELLHKQDLLAGKLCFPKVCKDSRELAFYIINSISQFQAGAYGIMEPSKDCREVQIEDISLFLVPGVAYSLSGERIGYGGGYYDATLARKNARSRAIGVAFDVQIIKEGFSDTWDRPVDGIITETQQVLLTNHTKEM